MIMNLIINEKRSYYRVTYTKLLAQRTAYEKEISGDRAYRFIRRIDLYRGERHQPVGSIQPERR